MSEDPKMTRRDEAESLLPFYVNGTLGGDDLALVEDWLANDPAGSEALANAEAEMLANVESNEDLRPHPNAFKRFADTLAREPEKTASFAGRLARFWQSTFAIPQAMVWATAAAALILAVVSVSSLRNAGGNDFDVAGIGEQAGASALVTFKPFASMNAVAGLLGASGVRIIDGPASGAFKLSIPAITPADYERMLQALSKSDLVQTVIPGRKPADAK